MNNVFDRMLTTLEHKYGKESHEAITFKLMCISYSMTHGSGKVTREKITDYWKKKIRG